MPNTLRSFPFLVPCTVKRLVLDHIPLDSPGLQALPLSIEELSLLNVEHSFPLDGDDDPQDNFLLNELAKSLAELPNLRFLRVCEAGFQNYCARFWQGYQAPFVIEVIEVVISDV